MKSCTFVATLLILVSCGSHNTEKQAEEVVSTGIDIKDADSVCYNGGVIISSFQDYNKDGLLNEEEPVNSVKTVCNGTNASISLNNLPENNIHCPTGGVLITSESGSVPVCNGEDGLQGEQGETGLAGQDGSSIIPVKFCEDSKANYPEYGLKIGSDIFAVFWTKGEAFLTKLTPGTYVTTTGNHDCHFTLE
jgi:hypothetical protein